MSVYFEECVVPGAGDETSIVFCCHPLQPLLAVGQSCLPEGCKITVTTDKGDHLSEQPPPPAGDAVTCLCWHPLLKLLIYGTDKSEVLCWSVGDSGCSGWSVTSLEASLCRLIWNDAGSILVAADQSGRVSGWLLNTDAVPSSSELTPLFHHHVGNSEITQLSFRPSTGNSSEDSLDATYGRPSTSVWRPKSSVPRVRAVAEAKNSPPVTRQACLYVGTASGALCRVLVTVAQPSLGSGCDCVQLVQADGGILLLELLVSDGDSGGVDSDHLLVLTDSLVLAEFRSNKKGALVEVSKVKLSVAASSARQLRLCWTGAAGVLAMASTDAHVRLWHVARGENEVLSLSGAEVSAQSVVTALSHCSRCGVLAVGTSCGKVVFYSRPSAPVCENAPSDDALSAYGEVAEGLDWRLLYVSVLPAPVKHCSWGMDQMLVVDTTKGVFVLRRHVMCTHFNSSVSAVQVAPSHVIVTKHDIGQQLKLSSEVQICGVYADSEHQILLWSDKRCIVYEISADCQHARVIGSFDCQCSMAVVYETSVCTIGPAGLLVFNLQGVMKQKIVSDNDWEGQPVWMDANHNWLLVGFLRGVLKLYDLSRRELKVVGSARRVANRVADFGELVQCRVNSTGSAISFIVAQASLVPDPNLYILHIESDCLRSFNFASGDDNGDGFSVPPDSAASENNTTTHSVPSMLNRERSFVSSHHWDSDNYQLVVCEATPLSVLKQESSGKYGAKCLLVSLFADADEGCHVYECFDLDQCLLLGASVPHYYLLSESRGVSFSPSYSGQTDRVLRRTMLNFDGLETCDGATRQAMAQFSFHSSCGNMDSAFSAIRTIKSDTVWRNLARMCVKSKRLDVARVCLANLGNNQGVRLLSQAESEPEIEARVAMLAVILGMKEEAAEYYESCGRWDLLVRFLQDAGHWQKAAEVAQQKHRIHVRHSSYCHAQHEQAKGELSRAASLYEQSETHVFEVPRMLIEDSSALQSYVSHSNDRNVKRWWAKYMESTGEMEVALKYYSEADDYLAMTRIQCYLNEMEKAAAIANKTEDRAACYHLARQYENLDDTEQAIHFYTKATAFGNAIRLCKDGGLEYQMLNLALLADRHHQLDVARYFEQQGRSGAERAVVLYHKAGLLNKAIDLAIKYQQFNALQQVALDVSSDCDPLVLRRCAALFLQNQQFDKAVDMLAASKQYIQALELCIEHNVPITDEVAKRLVFPKGEGSDSERKQVLVKLAECAYSQNNYHLATKKFVEAGDKLSAMKSLVKSGDTERIIYFAQTSRDKQIYILAANYLQTIDWCNKPEITRYIVTFYTKGNALSLLASFYESRAQVAVDDSGDYDGAVGWLNEAGTCLSKFSQQDSAARERQQLVDISNKLDTIKSFLRLSRQSRAGVSRNESAGLDTDPVLSGCRHLLEALGTTDQPVRRADVYSLLVHRLHTLSQPQLAYKALQQMKHRLPHANVSEYVDADVLRAVREWVTNSETSSSEVGSTVAVAGRRASVVSEVDTDRSPSH